MLIPKVHWLVIEDATEKTPLVTQLLQKTGLRFEHLTGKSKYRNVSIQLKCLFGGDYNNYIYMILVERVYLSFL